ncbi:MAG: SpoIID/LytB domain-containing protein [Actinomycetota bacterium]
MRIARTLLVTAIAGALLVPGPARAERTVTITGGGYGHGIGMSQYGALGRAKQGKSAEQILEHYYSKSKVASESIPSRVRVGLLPAYGSSTSSISFSSQKSGGSGRLAVKVAGRSGTVAKGGPGTSWRAEAGRTGGFRLFKNGNKVKNDGRTIFGDPSHPLVLTFEKFGSLLSVSGKSAKYAYGRAEIGSYDSSSCGNNHCARLVLSLPMQKYLYGLGEVPSSWPAAALKAQAIAGRTYALSKIERSGQHRYPCDCAVYDSTIDQAYIGDAKRTGSGEYWDDWKRAVDETDRQIVKYNGGTIQALYSSSSGGHTEDNENVWGGAAIPYLRGVSDKADKAGGDNPNHKWKITMSYATFSSKLNSAYGTGALKDFDLVKPFGVSGRVTMVVNGKGGARIEGSNKTARVSGWSLRSVLGLKDTLFRVDLGAQVGKKFRSRYNKLDGPGDPVSGTYSVPRGWKTGRGWAQDFRKGRMTRAKATGKTVWQWGAVLKKYDNLGREGGALGLPRTGVWGGSGFKGATYQDGRILWSKKHGVHMVRGSFERAYLRNGGPTGSVGLPTSAGKRAASLPGRGRKQRFSRGTLYLADKGGTAYALWGRIDDRYRSMGSAGSDCGYPVADLEKQAGLLRATFADGRITWTKATGMVVNCDV